MGEEQGLSQRARDQIAIMLAAEAIRRARAQATTPRRIGKELHGVWRSVVTGGWE